MLRKKIHAHLSHHKKESSNERGFIASGLRSIMNKNEKIIMGVLVSGILVFLAISIILLFGKGDKDTSSLIPTSTLGPTKKVNLTPYPTIPPIIDMTVMLNERMFNPSKTTIKRGNYIYFLNIGQNPITIEANDANSSMLNLGTIAPGDDKMVQFKDPGTYTYRNKAKPSETGVIVIE